MILGAVVLEIFLFWLTDVKPVGIKTGGRREAVEYRFPLIRIRQWGPDSKIGPHFLSSLLVSNTAVLHDCHPPPPQYVSKEPEGSKLMSGQLGLFIPSGSHSGAGQL